MSEKKVMNRWMIVLGAVLVQMALGSIYAFSTFNVKTGGLPQTLSTNPMDPATFLSTSNLALLGIFAISLAGFGLNVLTGGAIQDKRGPRNTAILGGILYAAAYVIASVSVGSTTTSGSFPMMYIAYALLGIGVGIGYSAPLAACLKWFPDKRGLIAGIAVAGFGAGSLIFAQVAKFIINSSGISTAYLVLGVIFLIMVVVGAMLLVNPPQGYVPAGWDPTKQKKNIACKKDFTWREMCKTKSFFNLWIMFALSATAGLMMIGNVSGLATFLGGIDTGTIATIVGIIAIFNAIGRIAWGFVSDKYGRTNAMKMMFLTQAVVLFISAAYMAMKPTDGGINAIALTTMASLIGFCFGGNFALFAPCTADYFGTTNYGRCYGLVFTAYAVGGVLGAIIPGLLSGNTSSYVYVFAIVGIGVMVAFAIAFITKQPEDLAEGPKAEATN
jgi:OFA family oxalate/formate antiporter-like MFS transporter